MWLLSARAVRCWVHSHIGRNPHPVLPSGPSGRQKPAGKAGSWALTGDCRPPPSGGGSEEGGDDFKSVRPVCPGLHTSDSGRYKGCPSRKAGGIPKTRSWCRSRSAIDRVKPESLVTAGQDTAVNTFPGAVHLANPLLPVAARRKPAPGRTTGAAARRLGWGMVAVLEGAARLRSPAGLSARRALHLDNSI